MNIKNEIAALTSFRFVLAFIVFLFHFKLHIGLDFVFPVVDNFIKNGAVFMTGFFILSGYIMTHVYYEFELNKKKEIYKFLIKRLARIYPVYLLMTIAFFIFIKEQSFHSSDWIKIVVNDIFLVQAFFPNMFNLGANGATWSISVETFFYILFPLFICIFKEKPKTLLTLSFLMSFVITINIIGDSFSDGQVISTYYSNPIIRLNEFIFGISLYIYRLKSNFKRVPVFLKSSTFISVIIIYLTSLNLSSSKYSYMGLQFLLIPFFGLLILNFHNAKKGLIVKNQLLIYFGRISYSFYLWQYFAIKFARYLKVDVLEINQWFLMVICFVTAGKDIICSLSNPVANAADPVM